MNATNNETSLVPIGALTTPVGVHIPLGLEPVGAIEDSTEIKAMTSKEKEIKLLIDSYTETQRKINTGTLPHRVTNVGDTQAMKLRRLRELGSLWYPKHKTIG